MSSWLISFVFAEASTVRTTRNFTVPDADQSEAEGTQAIPSTPFVSRMGSSIFESLRFRTSIVPPWGQVTSACMPSGASANSPGVGKTGTSGVSNVFATAPLARSTTKSLPDSELARSQRPSFVILEEKAILGREIDRTTALFAVSR